MGPERHADLDAKLRASHERLDAAISSWDRARREDNARKTEGTRQAREAALSKMLAAEKAHDEIQRRVLGL